MLFMVIERFKIQDPIPVYRRVRDPGIKFPDGLTYIGSWIEPNFDRCFQLMECDDLRLLQEWVLANNRDLGMTFETRVALNVSTLDSHPGKTLVGCSYKVEVR